MCVRNDQPPPPAVTSKHWGEMGRSAGPGILRLRGRVEGWASLVLLLKTLLPQVWDASASVSLQTRVSTCFNLFASQILHLLPLWVCCWWAGLLDARRGMLFELSATSRCGTELFMHGWFLAGSRTGATTVSKPSLLLGISDSLQVLITGYLRNLNWRYLPYLRPKSGNIHTKYGQKYGTNVPPF